MPHAAMSHTGPILEGRGDTDYERYVRVPELLELQKPVEKLSHPEERLFQTTHQAMFRLVQAMMDYDEAFLNWRFTHMRLAFRIIGSKVMSLKGVPAAQLESGTREPLFPRLWETISDLTPEFRPEY